jgi:hypothetical protein
MEIYLERIFQCKYIKPLKIIFFMYKLAAYFYEVIIYGDEGYHLFYLNSNLATVNP